MTKFYITFSGAQYERTTRRIVEDGPRLGADKVLVYDDHWLTQQEFYKMESNRWLWNHPCAKSGNALRGFGWFAWKPFILLDALMNWCNPGDIVLLTDADTYPIHDFSMLYEECDRIGGCMLFSAVGCWHNNWGKRDMMIVMGQDAPEWRDRQHAVARFMLFQAGYWKPMQLLMEWLTYCVNPLANTFDKSILAPEYPDLHEPRCEQAMLTNLAHKYGIKLYREACQFGESVPEDRDLYPQLFVQDGRSGHANVERGSSFRNV